MDIAESCWHLASHSGGLVPLGLKFSILVAPTILSAMEMLRHPLLVTGNWLAFIDLSMLPS